MRKTKLTHRYASYIQTRKCMDYSVIPDQKKQKHAEVAHQCKQHWKTTGSEDSNMRVSFATKTLSITQSNTSWPERGLDKQGHLRVHAPAFRPFSQGRPRTGLLLSQTSPGHVSASRHLSSLGFISGILVFISQPPSLNVCLRARHPVPRMTAERLENMCV